MLRVRILGPLVQNLKIKIEYESPSVHLLIRVRAGIVFVLIVRIEFDVIAHWQ